VYRFIDGALHLMAFTPTTAAADEILKASFPSPVANFPLLELVHDGKVAQIADTETLPDVRLRDIARARGFRSMLFTPLMSNGAPIGMIGVTRLEPGSFAAHHVQLLQTFADQAVIAIENVRLFDEVQARTDDLRESLTYQTAISNVLNVISRSPSDIQPVLDTIAETAQHLCQSEHAYIFRLDGDRYHLAAARDVRTERIEFLRDNPIAPDRGSTVGRVALERRPIHIMDALADSEYKLSMVGHGGRTILGVPLLRDGVAIGVIVLTRGIVATICRTADRTGFDLCGPGADRDRERPAVRRSAGAHRGLARIAAAADRDRRRAQGDQPLDVRFENGTRHSHRLGCPTLRCQCRPYLSSRSRSLPAGGVCRLFTGV